MAATFIKMANGLEARGHLPRSVRANTGGVTTAVGWGWGLAEVGSGMEGGAQAVDAR